MWGPPRSNCALRNGLDRIAQQPASSSYAREDAPPSTTAPTTRRSTQVELTRPQAAHPTHLRGRLEIALSRSRTAGGRAVAAHDIAPSRGRTAAPAPETCPRVTGPFSGPALQNAGKSQSLQSPDRVTGPFSGPPLKNAGKSQSLQSPDHENHAPEMVPAAYLRRASTIPVCVAALARRGATSAQT
jgi:hypothetical protein